MQGCFGKSNADHVFHAVSNWRQPIFGLSPVSNINDVMMCCVDPWGQRPADTVGWNEFWGEVNFLVLPLLWWLRPISYFINPFPAWCAYNQWSIGRGVISNCHHFTHPSGTVIYISPQPRKNTRKLLLCGLVWWSLLTFKGNKHHIPLHQTVVNRWRQWFIE